MLLLTQNIGESIYVFDKYDNEILKITYVGKNPNKINNVNKNQQCSQIRMGFSADKEITILREKIIQKRQLKGNVRKPDEPIFFMEEGDDYEDL
jgi:sRNA-binding carbon storage regulator CsrA